ncbi:MAG: pseudouridine-5'-phosphate glycosidase [Candidatus Eisenbacteria bacterium]|nr:pseudouridine-5'-phosphate glycosidase [Candidatus Eisenbacteria bacterium]
MNEARFKIADDVKRALAAHRAVVALETTVVSLGLPAPDGVQVARDMEAAVTASGAVPATIGVLDGAVRVGMSAAELDALAATPDVPKLNLSNFAGALVARGAGSTTVAATMLMAQHAGIPVFATGGIGGVHRGVAETDDVSADLTALSRIPVAVVCAGAKAILDLPRTVERLETLGVPVFGWRCDEFPAFWRRTSGLKLDQRFDDMAQMAEAIHEHFALGTGTGIVIANPVPEADELDEFMYDRGLNGALELIVSEGIRGRAVTPYILEYMQMVTGGEVVRSNVALLKDNARVAGELAVALAARG